MENKKKLIFEVEIGYTNDCELCPFNGLMASDEPVCKHLGLNCKEYDFSTFKLIGEE